MLSLASLFPLGLLLLQTSAAPLLEERQSQSIVRAQVCSSNGFVGNCQFITLNDGERISIPDLTANGIRTLGVESTSTDTSQQGIFQRNNRSCNFFNAQNIQQGICVNSNGAAFEQQLSDLGLVSSINTVQCFLRTCPGPA